MFLSFGLNKDSTCSQIYFNLYHLLTNVWHIRQTSTTNEDCFLRGYFTDLIFIDIMIVYAKIDAEIVSVHGKHSFTFQGSL